MEKKTKEQIILDRITSLEYKRERNVDRYIIPVEMEINKLREKLNKIRCPHNNIVSPIRIHQPSFCDDCGEEI